MLVGSSTTVLGGIGQVRIVDVVGKEEESFWRHFDTSHVIPEKVTVTGLYRTAAIVEKAFYLGMIREHVYHWPASVCRGRQMSRQARQHLVMLDVIRFATTSGNHIDSTWRWCGTSTPESPTYHLTITAFFFGAWRVMRDLFHVLATGSWSSCW